MSFVFPIMLGGLALLSVPVLLHLLQRQKPKILPFPAFRFLMQKHKTNQRSVRLRHLLLLILRMLLLALICLAVARPRMGRPVAAVLIFDTSYSMEYQISKKETRLKLAQQHGLELLDHLPEESQVAVYDTATNIAEWESVTNARKRIQNLKLSWNSTPVTATLDKAFAQLQAWTTDTNNPRQQDIDRLLCVFSDGTQNCWDQTKVPELTKKLDQIPPRLEQLQAAQANIDERIRLLQELPKTLPPNNGQTYNENKLRQLWKTLEEAIPTYTASNYPTSQAQTLLTNTRSATRTLIAQLKARTSTKLSDEEKAFRQTLLQSLNNGLKELQGVSALFLSTSVDEPIDLAIVDVQFPNKGSASGHQRNTFGQDEVFQLRVTVQATGKDFNSELYCDLNGKTMKQPVTVKAGQQQEVTFPVDCNTLRRGYHSLQVRLASSDLLPFNNTRFATFAIKDWRPVLILTDDYASTIPLMLGIEANEDLFRVDMSLAKYQYQTPNQPLSDAQIKLNTALKPYFHNLPFLIKSQSFQDSIQAQIRMWNESTRTTTRQSLSEDEIQTVLSVLNPNQNVQGKKPKSLSVPQTQLKAFLKPYYRTPSFFSYTKAFNDLIKSQILQFNKQLTKTTNQPLTNAEIDTVLAQLNRKQLPGYQAVYLVNAANPNETLWKELQTYVEAGGGLAISPPGGPTVKDAYNSPAAQALMPALLEKVMDRQKNGVSWNWNDGQLYKREMFAPVTHWQTIANLKFIKTYPRLAYFYWATDAVPNKSDPIVTFAKDNTPALLERTLPTGKCVLLTTLLAETDPSWNNYLAPDTTFCVALPNLLTRYLAGTNKEVKLNFAGTTDTPKVKIPITITAPTFDLIGPDKTRPVNRKIGQTTLTFETDLRPGNYILTNPEQDTVAAFSINAPTAESQLNRVPLLEMEYLFGKENVVNANENEQIDAFFGTLLPPFWKLLPWLLLGLLVFLVLENLLGNWFYRQEKPESRSNS